jgi:hypothetical protein
MRNPTVEDHSPTNCTAGLAAAQGRGKRASRRLLGTEMAARHARQDIVFRHGALLETSRVRHQLHAACCTANDRLDDAVAHLPLLTGEP